MRILVTGSRGMLGRDLMAHFLPSHEIVGVSRHDADITDREAVSKAITDARPQAVIHAAAWTAVDDCERNPELAFRVNAEGTRHVTSACRRLEIPLLYVSTDYVFDGSKPEPYDEDDAPAPLNVYGQSKLKGELTVRALLERFWIVRTSWLFGPWGKNFARTILDRARRDEPLRVVADQVGSPTYTLDLAEMLQRIIERAPPGSYHATNQGACSWFEFAREILRQAGLDSAKLEAISSDKSGRPARRPVNSRLGNRRLKAEGLGLLPPWQDALGRYLARTARLEAQTTPNSPPKV